MSQTELVNLRAVGTDPANPTAGHLLGTATLPVPAQRTPDDEATIAPLISCMGRLFQYATGSFSFGASAIPEYIEVVPVTLVAKFFPSPSPKPPTTP